MFTNLSFSQPHAWCRDKANVIAALSKNLSDNWQCALQLRDKSCLNCKDCITEYCSWKRNHLDNNPKNHEIARNFAMVDGARVFEVINQAKSKHDSSSLLNSLGMWELLQSPSLLVYQRVTDLLSEVLITCLQNGVQRLTPLHREYSSMMLYLLFSGQATIRYFASSTLEALLRKKFKIDCISNLAENVQDIARRLVNPTRRLMTFMDEMFYIFCKSDDQLWHGLCHYIKFISGTGENSEHLQKITKILIQELERDLDLNDLNLTVFESLFSTLGEDDWSKMQVTGSVVSDAVLELIDPSISEALTARIIKLLHQIWIHRKVLGIPGLSNTLSHCYIEMLKKASQDSVRLLFCRAFVGSDYLLSSLRETQTRDTEEKVSVSVILELVEPTDECLKECADASRFLLRRIFRYITDEMIWRYSQSVHANPKSSGENLMFRSFYGQIFDHLFQNIELPGTDYALLAFELYAKTLHIHIPEMPTIASDSNALPNSWPSLFRRSYNNAYRCLSILGQDSVLRGIKSSDIFFDYLPLVTTATDEMLARVITASIRKDYPSLNRILYNHSPVDGIVSWLMKEYPDRFVRGFSRLLESISRDIYGMSTKRIYLLLDAVQKALRGLQSSKGIEKVAKNCLEMNVHVTWGSFLESIILYNNRNIRSNYLPAQLFTISDVLIEEIFKIVTPKGTDSVIKHLVIPSMAINRTKDREAKNRKDFVTKLLKDIGRREYSISTEVQALFSEECRHYLSQHPEIYDLRKFIPDHEPSELGTSITDDAAYVNLEDGSSDSSVEDAESDFLHDVIEDIKRESIEIDVPNKQKWVKRAKPLVVSKDYLLRRMVLKIQPTTGSLEDQPRCRRNQIIFDNYEDYCSVFFPLIVEETRASIFNGLKSQRTYFEGISRAVNKLVDENLQMKLQLAHTDEGFYEFDVVQLERVGGLSYNKVSIVSAAFPDYLLVDFSSQEENTELEIESLQNKRWKISKIGRISTEIRQCQAIDHINQVPLSKQLLSLETTPTTERNIEKRCQMLSEKQELRAIMNSLYFAQRMAVARVIDKNGITLVQGPPGTGKTNTIVAAVIIYLRENPGHRVLVCSPTNLGVDELSVRINTDPHYKDLRLESAVRYGLKDHITKEAIPYFLDTLIDAQAAAMTKIPMNSKESINSVNASLDTNRKKLESITKDIGAMMRAANPADAENQRRLESIKDKLCGEIKILEGKKQQIEAQQKRAKLFKSDDMMTRRKDRLKNARVICCTLASSGHRELNGQKFNLVVIDEAAQAIEPLTVIPFQYNPQRVMLVGDPNQLPATIISNECRAHSFQRSLFTRLMENGYPVTFLDHQYRMHPSIAKVFSSIFYDSRVKNGPRVENTIYRKAYHREDLPPFAFFDLSGQSFSIRGSGSSYINYSEISFIIKLIQFLLKVDTKMQAHKSIAIISYYNNQVDEIRSQLTLEAGNLSQIEVNSVDGFQGREKDIIILSCVRSAPDHSIGFVADEKRINVSITRAKYACYIVGDMSLLRTTESWRRIHAMCVDNKAYFVNAYEHLESLEKAIVPPSPVAKPLEFIEEDSFHRQKSVKSDPRIRKDLPDNEEQFEKISSPKSRMTERKDNIDTPKSSLATGSKSPTIGTPHSLLPNKPKSAAKSTASSANASSSLNTQPSNKRALLSSDTPTRGKASKQTQESQAKHPKIQPPSARSESMHESGHPRAYPSFQDPYSRAWQPIPLPSAGPSYQGGTYNKGGGSAAPPQPKSSSLPKERKRSISPPQPRSYNAKESQQKSSGGKKVFEKKGSSGR